MAKTTKRAMKKKPQYVTKPMLKQELDKALAKGFAAQDARIDAMLDARFAAQDARIDAKFDAVEGRLSAEIARQTNAIIEYLGTLLTAFEDKYRDLPRRVAALEAKVNG